MASVLEGLQQDVRFALRQAARAPALAAAIVCVLAAGIGLTTALFAVRQALASRPAHGISDDPSLVRIRTLATWNDGVQRARFASVAEFRAFEEHADVFSSVAAWASDVVVVELGTVRHAHAAEFVTASFFELLGVKPLIGQFLPIRDDDVPAQAVLVSHEFWLGSLGADEDVAGAVLRVNGVPLTISGVLPPDFGGVDPFSAAVGERPSLWLPLGLLAEMRYRAGPEPIVSGLADGGMLLMAARLEAGVSRTEATTVASTIATRHGPVSEIANGGMQRFAVVVPLRPGNGDPGFESDLARLTFGFGMIALLVVVVGVVTASTLLLSRALRRRREIGVRLALGASRARLVRQLLTESVMLALAACALASLVVGAAMQFDQRLLPGLDVRFDWSVFGVAMSLTAIVGLVFGLAPAMHGARIGAGEVLKSSSAGQSRGRALVQRALVVAQIALIQPLLVGLGALIWLSLKDLAEYRPSSDREHVLRVTIDAYSRVGRQSDVAALQADLLDRLEASPNISRAALVENERFASVADLTVHPADVVPGRQSRAVPARVLRVGSGYFQILGVPLRGGRDIEASASDAAPNAVVIGRELADRLWGGADPIGRRLIRRNDPTYVYSVVGVAGHTNDYGHVSRDRELLYTPFTGLESGRVRLLLRTTVPARMIMPHVRTLVRSIDANLPEPDLVALADLDAERLRDVVRLAGASATAGLVLLGLSAVGLFSVVAFAVWCRGREIAVRIAVGARTGQVVLLFFRDGLKLAALGMLCGLAPGVIALRIAGDSLALPGVATVLVGVSTALVIVCITAASAWLPARRAAGIAPVEALRADG